MSEKVVFQVYVGEIHAGKWIIRIHKGDLTILRSDAEKFYVPSASEVYGNHGKTTILSLEEIV